MNSVSVKASQNYQVIIGNHLLPDLGFYISKIRDNCKAAIVSDTNVWPYYGQIVMDSLKRAGITPVYYIFPAGEASKNASTYLNILNFLQTIEHTCSYLELFFVSIKILCMYSIQ